MIQFLVPAALLAAAGILVPVLLHLWRPPARTVRLGSLRFLETVPGRRLRDLRWRDRLLLLLRVALLLALAALLAGPFWLDHRNGPQRWALLAPNAILDGPALQSWQQLLNEGYQPRVLAPGFPGVDSSTPFPPSVVLDAWSLLREADARVPGGSKIVLFAPPRAALLRGARPVTQSEVSWIATAARENSRSPTWIDSAFVIPSGRGLQATVGATDANATRYSILRVADVAGGEKVSDPETNAELRIRKSGDAFSVRVSGSKTEDWVPVAIYRPIRVAIVHSPQRAEDARFVAAAVRAVGEVSERPVMVEIREESASTVLPQSDWVFRLGAAPLTASMSSVLAESRVNVVTDAVRDAAEESRTSWFLAPDDLTGANGLRLWRRSDDVGNAGTTVWSDGFGNPLLTFAREGRAERWRFHSRFHPAANAWVESGAFPAWMRSLLLGQGDDDAWRSHDQRLVDEAQVQPAHATTGEPGISLPAAAGRTTDLYPWLWSLAALLLALERGVSHRVTASPTASLDPAKKRAPQPMAEVGP
jgi:Aerotolerance regulator N-terminal